jgi:hypothetical protein
VYDLAPFSISMVYDMSTLTARCMPPDLDVKSGSDFAVQARLNFPCLGDEETTPTSTQFEERAADALT